VHAPTPMLKEKERLKLFCRGWVSPLAFRLVCCCFHTMQDGSSNWLKGAMLILTYLFVAAGFWVSCGSIPGP
jgi:Ca2+/H+ antiporter